MDAQWVHENNNFPHYNVPGRGLKDHDTPLQPSSVVAGEAREYDLVAWKGTQTVQGEWAHLKGVLRCHRRRSGNHLYHYFRCRILQAWTILVGYIQQVSEEEDIQQKKTVEICAGSCDMLR
jgi:hypothetical protein